MSLVVCSECQRHVRAGDRCPFCPAPRHRLGAVAVAATLAGCSGSGPLPRDAPAYGAPPAETAAPAPEPEIPAPAPEPPENVTPDDGPDEDEGGMRTLYGAPPPEDRERPD